MGRTIEQSRGRKDINSQLGRVWLIILIIMSTQKSQEDLDFEAKLAKAFYKTTSKNYGGVEPKIKIDQQKGINGKFTDHLLYCGMYKNASLNTTADRDRWVNGSKDWMEHLG